MNPALLAKGAGILFSSKGLMTFAMFVLFSLGLWTFKKLDSTHEMLAKAELERATLTLSLARKEQTTQEIKRLLGELEVIKSDMKSEITRQKEELSEFSKKLDTFDFQTQAKENPIQAAEFVASEFKTELDCIEAASGNTTTACVRN